MNEFEWRRQMRDLREPLAPRPDLWTSIEAKLAPARSDRTDVKPLTALQRSTRQRPWLMAAGVAALALLGGGLATHYLKPLPSAAVANNTVAAAPDWKPEDPRLAGAATQLDAARRELKQAIEQSPDSPALQRLLRRTELQQTQLQQLAHEAS